MITIRKLATIAAATAMCFGLLTVPAASAQTTTTSAYDCPSGFTCLYSLTGGFGETLKYQDEGYWQNLRFTAKSIYNNRGNDAAVALQPGGQGGAFCIDSGDKSGDIRAKSVYLARTGGNC
ncbi:peptidase inhibitor family I36 protein [Streptomyces platensis]|uniref:peptidase inhibitor family I36 protein n=1 Tax=Streptomyces platensis TaxID=58346 RepID=UPI002E8019D2|nr:peptidase inhibitor family I36 protein [Streptomyces platensis]WUB81645.1 peptidase inhibitor family I36 protein [Streptomyces platensis]